MARAVIALDTNVLIYVLEANPEFGPAAVQILRQAQGRGLASELVYLELLGKASFTDSRKRRLALDFLADQQLDLVPLSRTILLRAADLRARASPKLGAGDAMHLATALETGARLFITNDHRLHALDLPGLRVVGLDFHGLKLDEFCQAATAAVQGPITDASIRTASRQARANKRLQ